MVEQNSMTNMWEGRIGKDKLRGKENKPKGKITQI